MKINLLVLNKGKTYVLVLRFFEEYILHSSPSVYVVSFSAGTTLATLTQVRDCKDILDLGISRHDSVQIISLGTSKKSVYCDMTTDEGGWTVRLMSSTE